MPEREERGDGEHPVAAAQLQRFGADESAGRTSGSVLQAGGHGQEAVFERVATGATRSTAMPSVEQAAQELGDDLAIDRRLGA